MQAEPHHEPYWLPNVEVVINDYTLALAEIEEFSKEYGPRTGGDVRITSRWGGPAAGGPGWGGPEIAVAIIVGEMLRRSASDAYSLVRLFITDTYAKIKTRTGARLYIDGAMAIGVDSETKSVRILFCFPEGLQRDEFDRRLKLVENHWPEVRAEFEESAPPLATSMPDRSEIKLCWDAAQQLWKECQPRPDDESRVIPDGWRHARLGDVTRISIGRTPARKRPEYWDPDKATANRWVTIADMRDSSLAETAEYISDLGAKESGAPLVPAGTPLMSFKLTVGRVAVAAVPVYTNEAIAAFFTNGEIERSFLTHALPTFAIAGDVDQAVKGQTLNTAKLRNIDVLLPPLREQRKIAVILSSVDEAIERTEAVIERVQEVKRALAQELLTRGMPGRHTRFKQTEVGEIPEDWEVVWLKDVARIQSGIAKNEKAIRANPVTLPYLRVANVQDGYIDLSEVKSITVDATDVPRCSLASGDVLFTEGGDFDKLGRGAVWDASIAPCLHQNHVFAVRPAAERLDPQYLAMYAASHGGKRYFRKASKQTTNLASVNATQLAQLPVALPRLDEQRAIMDALAAADANVSAEADRLAKLSSVKATLSSALLSGHLRVAVGSVRSEAAR